MGVEQPMLLFEITITFNAIDGEDAERFRELIEEAAIDACEKVGDISIDSPPGQIAELV
jgi:hypothetical protein